jgi:hypothetical protein
LGQVASDRSRQNIMGQVLRYGSKKPRFMEISPKIGSGTHLVLMWAASIAMGSTATTAALLVYCPLSSGQITLFAWKSAREIFAVA